MIRDRPERLGSVLVAVVVVLSGCTAPMASPDAPTTTGDATTSPDAPATTEDVTTTEDGTTAEEATTSPDAPATTQQEDREGIAVEGGDLPADPDRTFRRVQALLGSDVRPPDRVRVRSFDDRPEPSGDANFPPFYRLMGVDRGEEGVSATDAAFEAGGRTSSGDDVVVYAGGDETAVRYVLAHEFVHVVQTRNERPHQVAGNAPADTTDGAFAVRAVLEGIAVYVTDVYIDRHLDTDDTNAAVYDRLAERLSGGSFRQYSNSVYRFGSRYVEGRVDDPGAVERVYETPPKTGEQVIHGYAPDEEPPRPLDVTVEGDDEWSQEERDRMGEAWLRVALRNGLNESAADRAAAGWGTDDLRTLRNGNRTGYLWVFRFDDATNASEFHGLFGTYLDARGNRSGGVWTVANESFDLRRVAPETVAVVVGPESLTTTVTVRGSNGTVTATVGTADDAGEGRSGNGSSGGNGSVDDPNASSMTASGTVEGSRAR